MIASASARIAIVNSMKALLANTLDGTNPEFTTNLDGLVSSLPKRFEDIKEFPYVVIYPGDESFEYLPSAQQWSYFDVSILIYTRQADDEDRLIEQESLISDIKTLLDMNPKIRYNVTSSGEIIPMHTTDVKVGSVSTDKGLFAPFGFAELTLTVKYQPMRRVFNE